MNYFWISLVVNVLLLTAVVLYFFLELKKIKYVITTMTKILLPVIIDSMQNRSKTKMDLLMESFLKEVSKKETSKKDNPEDKQV